MRWYVEVSQKGGDNENERYCVDAKAWQAALQEARKLLGDEGPLSKFSIELLDAGYRAIDPRTKTAYVVSKAPKDAVVSSAGEPVNGQQVATKTAASDDSKAKTAKSANGSESESKAVKSEIIRERSQEPSEDTPIIYREIAVAVAAQTSLTAAEKVAQRRFDVIEKELEGRKQGKFVQIAVFDHKFDGRPKRRPLVTLAWKDWRGDPVIQYPARSGPPPAMAKAATPKPESASPSGKQAGKTKKELAAPEAETSVDVEVDVDVDVDVDIDISEPTASESAAILADKHQELTAKAAKTEARSKEPTKSEAGADEAAPEPAPKSRSGKTRSKKRKGGKKSKPSQSKPSQSKPSQSKSKKAHRHAENEDLISELFETMHDLHFASDIMSGADFVLSAIRQTLPCDLILIHVFDINSRNFVIVRADGPNSDDALMFKTQDTDGFFRGLMRRPRALNTGEPESDGVAGERWEKLGRKPKAALCAPARQMGRYLGVIELADPDGGGKFYECEANALDYICEQFAEFLAQRPIVVDRDVVLGEE